MAKVSPVVVYFASDLAKDLTGRIVQLPARNALEVEQLLASIREAGVAVEDVEMRKADLEDVFIDLMAGEQTPLEVAR